MGREERGLFGLRVYTPEWLAFREKDSPACRKLLEDVAILDPDAHRILAFRGDRFAAQLPETLWEADGARVLLRDRKGCFLLFGGICGGTNLLLALYFHNTANELSTVLCALDRREFLGLGEPTGAGQELFDLVAEVLFYLDGLLAPSRNLPLWTLVLRAANFAGCKLKKVDLPQYDLQLDPQEISLFLAFLICFFLSVRASGGAAEAETREDEGLSIRISALREDAATPFFEDAPFLHCDAFRRFKLLEERDRRAVILPIRQPSGRLSSGGRIVYLPILLEYGDD